MFFEGVLFRALSFVSVNQFKEGKNYEKVFSYRFNLVLFCPAYL